MSFSVGIVGLPNVGKSTLFTSLSAAKAEASNYPFCTIDPNVAVVKVPDPRLEKLAALENSKKVTPTIIEFYDIAGLVKGAHKGEGLGNQFLSHIREVDAIIHVVRCFPSQEIVHVAGKINPEEDIEIINTELILADLSTVEKRLSKQEKASKSRDKNILKEIALLQKLQTCLSEGKPVRALSFDNEEMVLLREFSLLTQKPVLYVANVDETGNKENFKKVVIVAKKENAEAIAISAKFEMELKDFCEKEADEIRNSIELGEKGIDVFLRASYKLLGLITYFTAGEKETRAWTIKQGTLAPEAAGKIHSDMEKGFIAAEIISCEDLLSIGSYAKAREKGKVRTEGKGYLMRDGDVVIFRFNV